MLACVYPNLAAELARKNMTYGALAGHMGCTPTTMGLKLAGKSPITLAECRNIRDILDDTKAITLDYLFATTSEPPEETD